MIEWGRASRGRVWHLLDRAAADTWCRAGDPIVEWTQGLPPIAGRPCPRCRDRVLEVAGAMQYATGMVSDGWSAFTERPVETVDLVGALEAEQQRRVAEASDASRYDPTHGRIDFDLQDRVDEMKPSSLGQRVALESTLQGIRDRGELE